MWYQLVVWEKDLLSAFNTCNVQCKLFHPNFQHISHVLCYWVQRIENHYLFIADWWESSIESSLWDAMCEIIYAWMISMDDLIHAIWSWPDDLWWIISAKSSMGDHLRRDDLWKVFVSHWEFEIIQHGSSTIDHLAKIISHGSSPWMISHRSSIDIIQA